MAVGTLMSAGGGIKIAEDGAAAPSDDVPSDNLAAADEEMARRLQAQWDAQAYGGAGSNRCVGGHIKNLATWCLMHEP